MNGSGFDRLPMWYGAEPDTTKNVQYLTNTNSEDELMQKLDIDFRTIRPRYIGPELKRYLDGTFDTMWGIKRGGCSCGMSDRKNFSTFNLTTIMLRGTMI
jgi:uroporphyrinogen decarboxylase